MILTVDGFHGLPQEKQDEVMEHLRDHLEPDAAKNVIEILEMGNRWSVTCFARPTRAYGASVLVDAPRLIPAGPRWEGRGQVRVS
jgi:hypothetical protein